MSPARKPMKNFVMNVIQLSAMYSGFVKSNSILPKPEARPPRQGPEQQAGQRAEHIAQMNARYLPDGDLYPAEYEYQSAQQAVTASLRTVNRLDVFSMNTTPLCFCPAPRISG